MGEAEAACIALYDSSDERLALKFASGEKSADVKVMPLALGQGILGKSASTIRRSGSTQSKRTPDPKPRLTKAPISPRSILATPIRRRQVLLGVLEVIKKRGLPPYVPCPICGPIMPCSMAWMDL